MKKPLLLLLLVIALLMFSGCGKKGELKGVKNIAKEDIFSQKEDSYYIYFHRIDCPDCYNVSPYVVNYADIIKNYENCSPKRKIYAVLLYTSSEKPGAAPYIFREYTGENGQGTDGKYLVDGITKWEDLYIGSTSSMITISTNASGVKVAHYRAQGTEAITAALEQQLANCHK